MVPEVTLIQNSKMDVVTKFQVSIFKNDEEITWNKLAQRQSEIGLLTLFHVTPIANLFYVGGVKVTPPLTS